MKNSTIIVILVALLLLGGAWYWFITMAPAATPVNNTGSTNTNEVDPVQNINPNASSTTGGSTTVGVGVGTTVGTVPMSATITYTANGFSPAAVTVKKGGTVTWVNEGTGEMWVASASHPTHTAYAGTTLAEHCDDVTDTSLDQCKNSDTYSFQFDKVGKWNYHNHSRSSHFGSVTVVE